VSPKIIDSSPDTKIIQKMTKISILAAVLSVSATLVGGLTFTSRPAPRTTTTTLFSVADDVTKQTGYAAGKANTEFARRFGHRAGMKVPTVSDSMTKFTADLDQPINALYRNYVTDLVATTHLTVVDARWSYDAVWALGMETVLDLLLKVSSLGCGANLSEAIAMSSDILQIQITFFCLFALASGRPVSHSQNSFQHLKNAELS